jgi:hypothetical protein
MPPSAPEIMWSFATVNRTSGTLDVPVHGVYAEWPTEFARIAGGRNDEVRNEPWGRIGLYGGDKIHVRAVVPEAAEQLKASLDALVRTAHDSALRERARNTARRDQASAASDDRWRDAEDMERRFRGSGASR